MVLVNDSAELHSADSELLKKKQVLTKNIAHKLIIVGLFCRSVLYDLKPHHHDVKTREEVELGDLNRCDGDIVINDCAIHFIEVSSVWRRCIVGKIDVLKNSK